MNWAERAQQIVVNGNVVVALAVAALAGFVSFASPCVLPLVPGYLSYMSGVSGQDLEQRGDRRAGRVVAGAALFDRPAVLPARLGALGPQAPPYTLVIDAKGRIAARVFGALPGDRPERQAALLTDLVERVT